MKYILIIIAIVSASCMAPSHHEEMTVTDSITVDSTVIVDTVLVADTIK